MKKFLWFLAGGQPFLLKECPEAQGQYTQNGLIIVLIALVSGSTAGYAVYSSFDQNLYASMAVGMIWFLIIMTIDSLIVSSIKEDQNRLTKIVSAIPRILIAGVIGLVIARPLEIKIFEKEIQNKLIDIRLKECIERSKTEVNVIINQTNELRSEKNQLEERYDQIREELSCVQNLLTDERNGVKSQRACGSSSGRVGLGTRYKELTDRINSLKKTLDLTEKRLLIINEQISKNEAIIQKSSSPCSKEDIAQELKKSPPTLLEAHTALSSISEESTSARSIIIFITLLIIAIEITPVINKLFIQKPNEEYQKKLTEFKKDMNNLSYLELLTKYPSLPVQKSYLKNFKSNKKIYHTLLQEYVAISALNAEVNTQMEIHLDQLNSQKKVAAFLNNFVAEKFKESQKKLISKIISEWEDKTFQDIINNPGKYFNTNGLSTNPIQTSPNQNNSSSNPGTASST